MDRFHSKDRVWPAIQARVKVHKKQVTCAIAFVGVEAPSILPLRKGDVLVCNASLSAIKQGSTSALALDRYRKKGVVIYSQPRLHGKVVVLSNRAFVGSANASRHSDRNLYEAVLETTNEKIVASARSFVLDLSTNFHRLNESDIAKLMKVKVTNKPKTDLGIDPMQPLDLPKGCNRLFLLELEKMVWSNKEQSAFKEGRIGAKGILNESRQIAGIEGIPISRKHGSKLKSGDWVVEIYGGGRISKPQKFLKFSEIDDDQIMAWFAVPRNGKKSVVDKNLLIKLNFIHGGKKDPSRWASESETKNILKRFY
jgi:hypothetical protein